MLDRKPLVLDEQQRNQIARRSRVGIYQALMAQAFMAILVVLLALVFSGTDAAVSALIGAATYYIPNLIFAVRLLLGYLGPKRPGSLTFFLGEALKLLASGLIVVLVAWQWGDWLNWLAYLLGLLGVMKGYLVLLLVRRMP